MLTTLKRFGLPIEDLKTIYIGFIQPLAEYAVPAWHPGLTEHQHYALERIQKRACRIMLGTKYDSYINALEQCQLTNLRTRREQICLQFINNWRNLQHSTAGYLTQEVRILAGLCAIPTSSRSQRLVQRGMQIAPSHIWLSCGIQELLRFRFNAHFYMCIYYFIFYMIVEFHGLILIKESVGMSGYVSWGRCVCCLWGRVCLGCESVSY